MRFRAIQFLSVGASVFLAAVVGLTSMAAAQADGTRNVQANALLADAVKLYREAEAVGGDEAQRIFGEVGEVLKEIAQSFPYSDPGLAILSNGDLAGIDLSRLALMGDQVASDAKGVYEQTITPYDNYVRLSMKGKTIGNSKRFLGPRLSRAAVPSPRTR